MANLFLDKNENFPLAADANVFGQRGGMEGVTIMDGVSGVSLDANMEQIEFAQSSSEVSLQTTSNGLEVQQGGSTVVSVASMNQPADVRFADGNVTVRQTGAATFEAEGADGSKQSIGEQGASVSVPLGNQPSNVGAGTGDQGGASVTVSGGNTGPFDASGADTTYNLESGTYTATIDGFGSGDVLDPFAGAAITVESDSDQSDGKQTVTFADSAAGTTTTLELTGLSSSEDSNLFKSSSFDTVFGEGTLVQDGGSGGSNDGSGGSGASGGDDTTQSGVVTDGPVANATVFADQDGDGARDADEPQTRTNSEGEFDFGRPVSGDIVAVGGTDTTTGEPLAGSLEAPAGSEVVSPVTSVIDTIEEDEGVSVEKAEAQVQSALDVPETVDPTENAPSELLDDSSADQAAKDAAADLRAAQASLASTAELAGSSADSAAGSGSGGDGSGGSGSDGDGSDASGGSGSASGGDGDDALDNAFNAIADTIAKADGESTLDLSDEQTVGDIVESTVAAAAKDDGADVDDSEVAAIAKDVATVASDVNAEIQSAVADAGSVDVAVAKIAKSQAVAQGNAAEEIETGVESDTLDEVADMFSGENLAEKAKNVEIDLPDAAKGDKGDDGSSVDLPDDLPSGEDAPDARILEGDSGDNTLDGGNGPDLILGKAGNDVLTGGNGNDFVAGGEGDDTLAGNNGADLLDAGAGADSLAGGRGGDLMKGGAGNDSLTGGRGGDVFVFGSDSGADTITDFEIKADSLVIETLDLPETPQSPSAEQPPEGEIPEEEMPEDEQPEGDEPTGDIPEEEIPEDEQPEGDEPTGEIPEEEIPEDEQPEGDEPTGDIPEEEIPEDEQPEGDEPTGEIPEEEIPEDEQPADDAPDDGESDEAPSEDEEETAEDGSDSGTPPIPDGLGVDETDAGLVLTHPGGSVTLEGVGRDDLPADAGIAALRLGSFGDSDPFGLPDNVLDDGSAPDDPDGGDGESTSGTDSTSGTNDDETVTDDGDEPTSALVGIGGSTGDADMA